MIYIQPAMWWPGCDPMDRLSPDEGWPLWEGAGTACNAIGRNVGGAASHLGSFAGTGNTWAGTTQSTAGLFNGTDNTVDLGSQAGHFTSDAPFSVTARVFRLGSGTEISSRNAVLTSYSAGTGQGWAILWVSTFDRYECYVRGDSAEHADTPDNTAGVGAWGTVGMTFSGGNPGEIKAYWNGQWNQTTAGAGYNNAGRDLWIGGGWNDRPADDFYNGMIQDVRLWDGRVLSAAEMMAVHLYGQQTIMPHRLRVAQVSTAGTSYVLGGGIAV